MSIPSLRTASLHLIQTARQMGHPIAQMVTQLPKPVAPIPIPSFRREFTPLKPLCHRQFSTRHENPAKKKSHFSNAKAARPPTHKPLFHKYRKKIDPRFAYLLSLAKEKLVALCKKENEQITLVAGKIQREAQKLWRIKEEGLRKENQLFAPLSHGIIIPELHPKLKPIFRKPYASAFITTGASSKDLANMGVKVRSQSGDVFSTFIPLALIPDLEKRGAIRYVELSRPLFPTLDVSIPYTQMDTLHNAVPPVTGAGVIVGVVDTAIDFYHPDFRDAAGKSRILYLWDQSLEPDPNTNEANPPTDPVLPNFTPIGGVNYGVEYDQATINKELTSFNPPNTPAYKTVRHEVFDGDIILAHGTHVTGIAAGNGLAVGVPQRIGAAPGADIIFSTFRNIYSSKTHVEYPFSDNTSVADACSYFFARAAQLQRACVINLSLGDNQGPHDGSTSGERFLDKLLNTPGRAITIAAGNSNNSRAHATGTVELDATTDLVIFYYNYIDQTTGIHYNFDDNIEIWYDGHDRFDITLTPPNGTPLGPISPGDVLLNQSVGDVTVSITSALQQSNGDNVISIIILVPEQTPIPKGAWTIGLKGRTVINGRFHAWVDVNNQDYSAWKTGMSDDTSLTLTAPGTAQRAITVGSHFKTKPTPTIAANSGRGPTRDGRIKPEISTIGVDVFAPHGRNRNIAEPGGYIPMSGTSMAAPHVAGACALLFECHGKDLSCADLKEILIRTAGTTGISVPDNGFGFGFMQLGEACKVPKPLIDVWVKDADNDTGDVPYKGLVIHECPDIKVLDELGKAVLNPTHNSAVLFNNLVQVTARNRGTETAHNVEVYLYWADPATNLHPLIHWKQAGIFTDGITGAGTYTEKNNKIIIPEIPSGGKVDVTFAWAPPMPGSNLRGDNHFCLITRLEHDSDPSKLFEIPGFNSIRFQNNLGLRNVHVKEMTNGSDASTSFYIVGSGNSDSLQILTEGVEGDFELLLPTSLVPIRDAKLIEKHCGQSIKAIDSYVTRKADTQMIHDISGADLVNFKGHMASVIWRHPDKVTLQQIKLGKEERLPARITVKKGKLTAKKGFIRVIQMSAGRIVGGITLEVRPPAESKVPPCQIFGLKELS